MNWVSDLEERPERSRTNSLIGHVIGFMHEQERPDTCKWTKFDCGALNGFEEAKKRVASIESAIEPAFTAGMSVDSRINLVSVQALQFGSKMTFTDTHS